MKTGGLRQDGSSEKSQLWIELKALETASCSVKPADPHNPYHWLYPAPVGITTNISRSWSWTGSALKWKSAQRRRKHCALAAVRRSQNNFRSRRRPPSGGAGRPKFNQLEMVSTFTYKPSLVRIDACNFELSW